MAAFSGRQRAEFAVLADKQLSDGVQSCEYPQVNTLAMQLDAYYTAVKLPLVTGVDITFNHALPQVVFKAHGRGGSFVFMCFPCANAKRRMYELTQIINAVLASAAEDIANTTDLDEALTLCRARAAELCASYAAQPAWAKVQEALQGGAPAVVWTSAQVVALDFKPVLPGQFKRAFERAGVAVCDTEGQWLYELRLLGTGPSGYALGAKDGQEEEWANNADELLTASMYLRETAGVREIIKGGVVVYFE